MRASRSFPVGRSKAANVPSPRTPLTRPDFASHQGNCQGGKYK